MSDRTRRGFQLSRRAGELCASVSSKIDEILLLDPHGNNVNGFSGD